MRYGLTICIILGLGVFSCTKGSFFEKDNGNPRDIDEAFEEVVEVLHAPYVKNALFFGFDKSTVAINETKQGSDAKLGNRISDGSGTWSVKETPAPSEDSKDKDVSILYEYIDYKPQGSAISVTGKMEALYRSEVNIIEGSPINLMGFNKTADAAITEYLETDSDYKDAEKLYKDYNATKTEAKLKNGKDTNYENIKEAGKPIKERYKVTKDAARASAKILGVGLHIDTLKITGAYDATLTFEYKNTGKKSFPILDAKTVDYGTMFDKILEKAEAEFTFTYKNQSIILNKKKLRQLLFCIER